MEVPNDNDVLHRLVCVVQMLIYIHLLTITVWVCNFDSLTRRRIDNYVDYMYTKTLHDIINLSTPFLQAY